MDSAGHVLVAYWYNDMFISCKHINSAQLEPDRVINPLEARMAPLSPCFVNVSSHASSVLSMDSGKESIDSTTYGFGVVVSGVQTQFSEIGTVHIGNRRDDLSHSSPLSYKSRPQQATAAICIVKLPRSATNKGLNALCFLPRGFANSVNANTNEFYYSMASNCLNVDRLRQLGRFLLLLMFRQAAMIPLPPGRQLVIITTRKCNVVMVECYIMSKITARDLKTAGK
uniref:Uncharacterized protein n=1 Tax=Glossina pallidipes TaxID=7398 RepID=A0A1A9ZMZ4_GLOPL